MADFYGSLNRLLDSFKNKIGLTNLVPGTKAYQIAESIAFEQTAVEKKIDEYASRNSIFTAADISLNKIGFGLFGIPRLEELSSDVTASMKVIKFYVDFGTFGDINRSIAGLPQDIILPAGTSIFGDVNGISYLFNTIDQVKLPANESVIFVSAKLMQGGVTIIPTNTLVNHSFSSYATGSSKLLKVTNPSPVGTGRQRETDDNYRYRISNTLRSGLSTTYYGIESKLLEIPGVATVNIQNATGGGGSFSVFVQGTTPVTSDDLIATCNMALSRFVPDWVQYNIFKPFYIGLEIILNVTVKQKNDAITSNVISSISSSINNFNGSEFFVNSIIQQAQASDVNILSVSFELCRKYAGTESYRTYTDVLSELNPVINIFSLEKLIIEPIPNAITVNQIL